jgi:hypothetical protein
LKQIPHTAPWIAQRIHEDKSTTAIGILRAWTHIDRQPEADKTTIEQLNQLNDEEVFIAIQELASSKQYIQGSGGNKLLMKAALLSKHKSAINVKVLVDSGSTGSCIHRQLVKESTKTLPRPIPVYNTDRTLNQDGDIKETVTIRLLVQDHEENITLAVSNIGKADIFLGFKCLQHHNPSIDWTKSHLSMDRCPHTCQYITSVNELEEEEEEPTIKEEIDDKEPISLEEGDHLYTFNIDGYLESQPANAFYLNHTNYDYIPHYNPEYGKYKDWKDIVPPQYHSYKDIFTQKDFDKLSERRPWDHAIELTPGYKATNCKTYPLSQQEQKDLQEFIDENLRTGRIHPSKSPMASPFFFVKKKDGKLRPTQDY